MAATSVAALFSCADRLRASEPNRPRGKGGRCVSSFWLRAMGEEAANPLWQSGGSRRYSRGGFCREDAEGCRVIALTSPASGSNKPGAPTRGRRPAALYCRIHAAFLHVRGPQRSQCLQTSPQRGISDRGATVRSPAAWLRSEAARRQPGGPFPTLHQPPAPARPALTGILLPWSCPGFAPDSHLFEGISGLPSCKGSKGPFPSSPVGPAITTSCSHTDRR